MRVLAVVILLLEAAPAAHARSGPCRTGDVPRATAKRSVTEAGWRYAVVACDADRRRRVLRRTRLRRSETRGALGRVISDAEAAGRFVVWGELVYRRNPRRVRAVIVQADHRGRVTRRRTAWRARLDRKPVLDVAVLRDGSAAWNRRGRVVLARPGRPPRAFGPPYAGFLGAEDERTLRWDRGDDRLVYRDLLPVPLRNGCPRRERFHRVSSAAVFRATQAYYNSANEDTYVRQVMRVCVRRDRRDVVVAQSSLGAFLTGVTLLTAEWAVVWGYTGDKYGCGSDRVTRTSLRRGQSRSLGADAGACGVGPREGTVQAITPAGSLAWVHEPIWPHGYPAPIEPYVATVRATAGDRSVVLDEGAPGAITDLRADGETYRWRNAGEARSAPAP